MGTIIAMGIIMLSWFVGVFGFTQIFICLFFAIPTLNDMKRQGVLHKNTPVYKKYLFPIMFWAIIIIIYMNIIYNFVNNFYFAAIIGIVFSAIMSFFSYGNNNDFDELFEQNKQYML